MEQPNKHENKDSELEFNFDSTYPYIGAVTEEAHFSDQIDHLLSQRFPGVLISSDSNTGGGFEPDTKERHKIAMHGLDETDFGHDTTVNRKLKFKSSDQKAEFLRLVEILKRPDSDNEKKKLEQEIINSI